MLAQTLSCRVTPSEKIQHKFISVLFKNTWIGWVLKFLLVKHWAVVEMNLHPQWFLLPPVRHHSTLPPAGLTYVIHRQDNTFWSVKFWLKSVLNSCSFFYTENTFLLRKAGTMLKQNVGDTDTISLFNYFDSVPNTSGIFSVFTR